MPIGKIETFKQFTFEAAHSLQPYSGLHGHSFTAEVCIAGDPDPEFGWPGNLYDFEPHIQAVRQELDHKYLNEIPGLSVPSIENVCRWIWERLVIHYPGLERVVVTRGSPGQMEGCVYRGPERETDRLRP
jgi:6-pyruvoyltetrahydropterin/6-carboxytetrahydropterin synthase